MAVTRQRLSEEFQLLNDEALLASYHSGELTDLARRVAFEELQRRAIDTTKPTAWGQAKSPEKSNEEDLVPVARLFTAAEANMLQARLEAEGVPAVVTDAQTIQTMPLMSIALGGVRVLVPASYLDQAREIATAIERGDYAIDDRTDTG